MTELLKEKAVRYGSALRTFLFFLWKNFMQDRVLLSAGSLAFQTLLSIVPLMAVILSVLSISPVFESFKRNVEDFILQNFVPASGVMAREYFWQFISNTATVPTVGGIFLFIIALFLISTIDHTINQIWDVHAPRKLIQGFTLYWTVLTVGPIIIGTGLFASSYVWYTVFTQGPLLEVRTRLLSYLPLVNSFLAFFLLYMLVPNRRVRFAHACWGALLATLLFELSKKWFSFYVSSFATFEHIYGALSVVPLLFFWIYLIWVVALTGAEFVYCLGAMKPEAKETPEFHPLRGMRDVLEVLEHIWRGQQAGEYVSLKKTVRLGNGFDGSKPREIIDFLIRSNHVHVTADGGLALSSDIHTLSLYDLYSTMPSDLAGEEVEGENASHDGLRRLDELEDNVRECFRRTMHDPVAGFMNIDEEGR